ncbi:MAG: glycoside hydrolase family 5 protein [Prolixibacteraceae bacterium]
MEFLSTKGIHYISNNKPVQLKGVGLGNWLTLEHFMFGLPGTDSQIRQVIKETYGDEKSDQFWDKYYATYVTEEDIKYVHNSGMNHIRIPINYKLFFTDSFEKSVAIREIDRIVVFLKKYKIWGIIDIHAVPGGQNPDWHSDNHSGKDNFWSNDTDIDLVAALWGRIAEYYKTEPAIGGYDLINEPCFFTKESELKMLDFFRKCTRSIRAVDSNHIIFYAGNTYSRDFSMFTENLDDNSSYTFHLYPFLQIPDAIDSEELSAKLNHSLRHDVTYEHLTTRLKKPLWCGETGHPMHLSNSYNTLYQFISILENNQIAWALWPLKDCGAMAMTYAKKDGDWNKLCMELSGNWVFWNIFTKDSILSAEKEDNKYIYYQWLANESTKAFELVRENIKKLPYERLYKALDDFRFDNCMINDKLLPR